MVREIGSIYELECVESEDITSHTRSRVFEEFPLVKRAETLGYKEYCFVSCGRDAINLAIDDIERKVSDSAGGKLRCLLPMYTCDTVIIPFEQHGFKMEFYPLDKGMKPVKEEFVRLVEDFKPDVVLIHGYHGIDTHSEIRSIIGEYKKQGIKVIEDLTQCLYMELDGCADYYVLSLRKWLQIPDGGLIVAKESIESKPLEVRKGFVDAKVEALTQKCDYLNHVNDINYQELQLTKKHFLERNNQAEEMLDVDNKVYAISDEAVSIMRRTDWEHIEAKRCCNAQKLYELLSCQTILSKGIELPLSYGDEYSDGVYPAPLYLPIYVMPRKCQEHGVKACRQELQAHLREKDIYIPVLWPVPTQIKQFTEETEYIYANMLAIPCDQRYSCEDMQGIADAIADWG